VSKRDVAILDILLALIGAWAFMLGVGIVHAEWIPQCPTIGYGWSLVLFLLFGGALECAIKAMVYGTVRDAIKDER
jgi:hypothetical protein